MMVDVCPSLCRVPRPNSRTERPIVHHVGNSWTYLEVKRTRVKVTRTINAVTDNATYAGRVLYSAPFHVCTDLFAILLIQTIVFISFYLPPGRSIFTSGVARGHPYALPTCTFDLFKNSFTDR